jgi:hypothetical protein
MFTIYIYNSPKFLKMYFWHLNSTVSKTFIISVCAGSSGPVHNVVLIDVYLDLETPGGRDFG